MYGHLFGPVPSRRLGMSLGIDLVPHKVCSYNCVYCECGRTTLLTPRRKEYVPADEVTAELERYFAENPAPDFITFSGSGEPTLNSRLGDILRFAKNHFPHVPVAVLTNGSLFGDPGLREELADADIVLPSLDAADERTFRKINHPHRSIDLGGIIEGLAAFKRAYRGRMLLEVLVLPGYNDAERELAAVRDAIARIRPDEVQLNTLDRPGTVEGLVPIDRARLEAIAESWDFVPVEVIGSPTLRTESGAYRGDIESAILETVARRPCTAEDIGAVLGIRTSEANKYIGVLEADGRIVRSSEARGIFYRLRRE